MLAPHPDGTRCSRVYGQGPTHVTLTSQEPRAGGCAHSATWRGPSCQSQGEVTPQEFPGRRPRAPALPGQPWEGQLLLSLLSLTWVQCPGGNAK